MRTYHYCAFSGFADGHRIQYQNVFLERVRIGHQAIVSFAYESGLLSLCPHLRNGRSLALHQQEHSSVA
jgi:hypothetical protein